jgi:hypothetical protein
MHFTPLPPPDDAAISSAQFEHLTRLFTLAHGVGDALGSEATDPAQLLLVDAVDLAACARYFPKEFIFEPLPATRREALARSASRLGDLVAALPDREAAWGVFHESDVSAWVCIFWDTKEKFGANLLLRAHRVET